MRTPRPAIINAKQQISLEAGQEITLLNNSAVMFPDDAAQSSVGDLWWVKEPWILVTSARYDGPKHIERRIPGRYPICLAPPGLQDWWHVFRKVPCAKDAVKHLKRGESRAYLRILEITPAGFRCSSHMQNVDTYLSSLSAENAA